MKADALGKALSGLSLEADALTAAVGKAREGHFQIACTMVYEARHWKLSEEGGVQHPHQYFAESRKYYKEKEAKEQQQTMGLNKVKET